MIKILREGKKKFYRQECTKCGCIFQYLPKDIENGLIQQGSHQYYPCPNCYSLLYIKNWYESFSDLVDYDEDDPI